MFLILVSLAIFTAFYWTFILPLTDRKSQRLHGIYSVNEGFVYNLKRLVFSFLLVLQNVAKSRKKSAKIDPKTWEEPRPFPADNPLGNDSVFFIGSCQKTGLTFILATERRPQNITYGLVYLWVIKHGLCPLKIN